MTRRKPWRRLGDGGTRRLDAREQRARRRAQHGRPYRMMYRYRGRACWRRLAARLEPERSATR
jgi:hypothetical protein